jgi:hypothetical protein
VDIAARKISKVFQPTRKMDGTITSKEPPVTKMFLSTDGQWVAAINCFGDIYIFNLEVQRYASWKFKCVGPFECALCLVHSNSQLYTVYNVAIHKFRFPVLLLVTQNRI